jgi:serine-type D-Ala-D-Ala carboxypeptidase/endopeptidase
MFVWMPIVARKIIFVFCSAIILTGCINGPGFQSPTQMPQNVLDTVNNAVLPMLQSGKSVGMSVGIIKDGQRYVFGYGKTHSLIGSFPTGDTIFEIGSLTKTFTCIVLAEMIDQGQLRLDDTIQQYLPEGVTMPRFEETEITLRHLATHTSGLPRIPNDMESVPGYCFLNPYANYTVEDMYAFLSRYQLTRKPGTQYEYSNLGMGLLGNLLASKNDMTYEQLVEERICNPLHLADTRITLSSDQRTRLSQGYTTYISFGTRPVPIPVPNLDLSAFEGAGALRSTLNDLLSYAEACMGITETSLRAAMDLSMTPDFTIDDVLRVGLGWHFLDANDGSEPVVWHDGATGGHSCFLGFLRESKIAVILLNNTDSVPDLAALQILDGLSNRDFSIFFLQ